MTKEFKVTVKFGGVATAGYFTAIDAERAKAKAVRYFGVDSSAILSVEVVGA